MSNGIEQDVKQTMGKSALGQSAQIGKALANSLRTTLGPMGCDKLIFDGVGDIIITNDGATILNEYLIEHPIGKIMRRIARSQEQVVGDGTTSAIVFGGELIFQSLSLIMKNVHPNRIIRGYNMALKEALIYLKSKAVDVDEELLIKVLHTAMTGKSAEGSKELLTNLLIESNNILDGDVEELEIKKITYDSIENSELVKGIILETKLSSLEHKKELRDDFKALCIKGALIPKSKNLDKLNINIDNIEAINQISLNEEEEINGVIQVIKNSGCNLIITNMKIDDNIISKLDKVDIDYIEDVGNRDLRSIAKAYGKKVVFGGVGVQAEDVIYLEGVEKKDFDTYIHYNVLCPNTATILIHGSNDQITNEVKRALEDCKGDLRNILRNSFVVAGAGSIEMMVSKHLYKFADTLAGKEQVAVKIFADSLETIPNALIENAGLDVIDLIAKMRAGADWTGVDIENGIVADAWDLNVVEPLGLKEQYFCSAVEFVEAALRIDEFHVNPALQGKEVRQ